MNRMTGTGRITVAVTGLHRGENPQPGAAVVASIRRLFPNIRIIGLSYDPLESSLYGHGEEHPDQAYLIPFPGAGADALFARLDAISAYEDISVIIPCLDSEIPNYIALLPKLRERGVQCVIPNQKSFEARSKLHLHDFCRDNNVPYPRTRIAAEPRAVAAAAAEIGLPVYVKGKHYEARLVTTEEDLHEAAQDIARVWGWPILVQEVVSGEEYDIAGIGDGQGGIIKSCTVRKILRSALGKGFAGVVVKNPSLDDIARRIIAALKWSGPFELEFLKATGRPHTLFEINPRFPAWIDFPSRIGCNLPGYLLQERLGVSPKTELCDCAAGQMFIRHCTDIVGNIFDLARIASTGEVSEIPEGQTQELHNES